ncbi:MAG TPA: hypothetical protein VI365_01230 [Trebonia sp.]
MKHSRLLSVAAAAAVVAGSGVWGMSHSGGSAGAKPPVVTVNAANAANAASEPTCTVPSKIDGPGTGEKANVSLCAFINGQALTVKFNADCFGFGVGDTEIKPCLPNGSWSLYEGDTLVAGAGASVSAPYPGPGTYTLKASVKVDAVIPNAGFTTDGKISRDITLTTAIPPGARLEGGTNRVGRRLTVTVTNVGDKLATGVKINIEASGSAFDSILREKNAFTDDKRCRGRIQAECELGTLAQGASASVELSSGAGGLCNATSIAFAYTYTADGLVSVGGYGPC